MHVTWKNITDEMATKTTQKRLLKHKLSITNLFYINCSLHEILLAQLNDAFNYYIIKLMKTLKVDACGDKKQVIY